MKQDSQVPNSYRETSRPHLQVRVSANIGCKEGIEFSGHHHTLPPMKGALWAWEALQHLLKVVAEYSDLLKFWARIEGQDIDPGKGGDFIIHDGCVHIC